MWRFSCRDDAGGRGAGGAQAVTVNLTTVEFPASPDQRAIRLDGAPLLTSYELRIYRESATEPVTSQDVGKPTPDAQGLITLSLSAAPSGFGLLAPQQEGHA